MAFQQSDLDSIEQAIASGALTVRFSDKEVTYRSMADMMQARDLIRKSLGHVKRTNRNFVNFSKGLDSCDS